MKQRNPSYLEHVWFCILPKKKKNNNLVVELFHILQLNVNAYIAENDQQN